MSAARVVYAASACPKCSPGVGVGFRLMLNKRSQTNLCLDIGWGKNGARAVYFAVQEAL